MTGWGLLRPVRDRLGAAQGRLLRETARSLLPAFPKLEDAERARVEADLEVFLAAQIAAMPRYLRAPVVLALLAFELLPVIRYGRRYTALDEVRQRRILQSWARSRLGPKRDLITLIRSSTLFSYLDHEIVRRRLEAECETHSATAEFSRGR